MPGAEWTAKQAIPRIALVAGALVVAILLLGWQRDDDRCSGASEVLAAKGDDRPSRTELDEAVSQSRQSCEPEGLRHAAALLVLAGDRRAASLAREATSAEPRNFRTWITLSTALERSDPSGAERARRRAIELNPRLAGPREP